MRHTVADQSSEFHQWIVAETIYSWLNTLNCTKKVKNEPQTAVAASTCRDYWLLTKNSHCRYVLKSKVKLSHTRYRMLGPELILVYRQSACRWLLKSSPGGRLPLLSARPVVTYLAKERRRPSTSTKLYCLVTEAHRCQQLVQGCYTDGHSETRTHDLNDHKSNSLPLGNLRHLLPGCNSNVFKRTSFNWYIFNL